MDSSSIKRLLGKVWSASGCSDVNGAQDRIAPIVPLSEISQATGIPEERLAMMAQIIRKDGLADEYMASMMKMATGNGVGIDKILAMLTSLGVPRSQATRVARSQGLMDDREAQRILDEERCAQKAAAVNEACAGRRRFLKKGAIIVFWVLVWQLLDMVMNNRLVLAGPVRVAQALAEQVVKPDFWAVCGASLLRIAAGFLLSFVVGILLSLVAYRVRIVRDLVEPIVSLLRTIPVVSIIMLLIWVGNQALTVYLSFLIVLPLIYTNMLTGLENVDPQMLEMARVYKLSRWRTFLYVYRPALMPFLSSSSKLALGMSWKSGIMAEALATPKPSIGKEMAQARTYLNTPDLFAWTVVVMIMS